MSATQSDPLTAALPTAGGEATYRVRFRKRKDLIHPPADWDFPRRTIVVTGMQRAGTNYLCSLIANTGVLGRPTEYFTRGVALKHDPVRGGDIAVQVTFPNTVGRTPNGIAAMKLFPFNWDEIAPYVNLFEFYPDPVFVHASRRDLLGQAISFTRALQTGQWAAANVQQFEPHFSAEAIHEALMSLVVGEARLRAYFARNQIAPIEVVYEDLLGHEADVLGEIARRVGLDEADCRFDPPATDLKVQRDDLNADWRARFLRERGDPNRLEIPALRESRGARLRSALRGLFRPE
ncbi:MAG: Stf0 family sulfotransferase [Thermohalobaculum sp.]|nr:Stf0 family sulfotransferase [Thermohalobaculum sp.]